MMRNKNTSILASSKVLWWGLFSSLSLLSLLSSGRSLDLNKKNDRKNILLDENHYHLHHRQLQYSNSTTNDNTDDSGRIVGGTLAPFGKYPSFASDLSKLLYTYGL
jgi:hypothetical protein